MARIAPAIHRDEYNSFAALLRDDPAMPRSYVAWVNECAEHRATEHSRGEAVLEVPVKFDEFKAYCLQAHLTPSIVALQAFAVKKAPSF